MITSKSDVDSFNFRVCTVAGLCNSERIDKMLEKVEMQVRELILFGKIEEENTFCSRELYNMGEIVTSAVREQDKQNNSYGK